MLKIEMLRCFVTVARSGNLADAGDKLARTPSAVSMMLKQFETHLGGALFESERKSRLTALGEFVLEQSVVELEHFDRTVATIESFARSESGFVRVAAVPSFAEAVLPSVVRTFLERHPGVRIDVQDMDSAAVIRELEGEHVDLGIATDVGIGADITRDALFSDAFGVVCRTDHEIAASGGPLEWSALAPWPFIANGVCGHIQDADFQRIFSASTLMVRNTTSLLAMVRAGVGLTVLPRLVVDQAERELSFVPVADPAARRQIDILQRAYSSPSPATMSFVQAIHQTVGRNAAHW